MQTPWQLEAGGGTRVKFRRFGVLEEDFSRKDAKKVEEPLCVFFAPLSSREPALRLGRTGLVSTALAVEYR